MMSEQQRRRLAHRPGGKLLAPSNQVAIRLKGEPKR